MTEEQTELICDFIEKLMKSLPEDEKADAAEFISVQATIWGAMNTYEGIGILDVAKRTYLDMCESFEMIESEACEECKCGGSCGQVPMAEPAKSTKNNRKNVN